MKYPSPRMKRTLSVFIIVFFANQNYAAFAAEETEENKEKNISLSGSLTAGYGLNSTSGAYNPYNRNPYNINFSPVLKIYSFSLPFTFYLTNTSKGFDHPFNRIGVSPTWKWLKFHIGYRSLNLSPYVLNGKVFLGGGLEMTPGKFRFAFIGGRLEKSQNEDTLSAQTMPPAYQRYGFGGKIGFGSAKTYIDLLLFKGKDVANSIYTPVKSGITPSENAAAGLSFSIPFSKRIMWQTNIGLSLYTRDVSAVSYPVTSHQELLNNGYIKLNMSSQYVTAGESTIRYTGDKGSFTFKYRRIDPEYQTMGIFYLQTDLSEYSILFNKYLLKDRISVNGNFSESEDNIHHLRNTLTRRVNGGVIIAYSTGKKWKLDLNIFASDLSQQFLRQDVADSLRLNQLNKMISCAFYYVLDNRQNTSNTVTLSTGYNAFSNLNPEYVYDFSSGSININTSFRTLFKNSKANLTESAAIYLNTYGSGHTNTFSIGETFGKAISNDKLSLNAGINLAYSEINDILHRKTISLQAGVRYKAGKNDVLSFNGNIQNGFSSGNANTGSSSFNISYTHNFNTNQQKKY